MNRLNLSNQMSKKQEIEPYMAMLKALLEQRRAVWSRLPPDRRKKWLQSGKDPVLQLAWDVYRYLRDNFFQEGTVDG